MQNKKQNETKVQPQPHAFSHFNQIDWWKLSTNSFYIVTRPVIEIFFGIRSGRIPLAECLLMGGIVGSLILVHFDQYFWIKLGIISFYPKRSLYYFIYCGLTLFSGFWFWGVFQTVLRNRLIRRLSEALLESGLMSSLGRLPPFIFDYPVEFTRKLRLGRASLSKEQFEKAKPRLESNLQVYIDEFRENREGGTMDIIYAHSPMPTLAKMNDINAIPALSFVVGKTRAKEIIMSLQTVPHLLVAGQTGGGKSTFLRGLITSLYLNNRNFEFTLIDLKGGLEFQIFEDTKGINVIPSVAESIKTLKNLEDLLKLRMAVLKENKCKDIDAYLALPPEKQKEIENITSMKGRHVLVVDEAAEMFLAGSHASTSEIQSARKVLSQIARQGRSAGVHLVIATQRPDAKALDPQVKANLTGVLCFQMLNDSSSITVLGTGRATDLPPIPGRAIWKSGSDMLEVQTPYVDTDEVVKLLEPYRKEEKKTEGEGQ
jgi:hypothetical protein